MELFLVFALTLVVAVLLSEVASRSIVSTAALFLLTGIAVGLTDLLGVSGDDEPVVLLVEIALFATLYTDAMRVGVRDLGEAWRLPGRALLLGMPLVFGGTALLTWLLLPVSWTQALLVGAVLSPTDPVLANAIIGREAVPQRLRFLLGVEAGLNDGLALPVVLLILAALGGTEATGASLATELAIGVAIGVALPYIVVRIASVRGLGAVGAYEQLLGFAIGVAVFAVAEAAHANLFLAAFAAGVTVRTVGPEVRETFHGFGEVVSELLKLLGLLVFGLVWAASDVTGGPWTVWALAFLVVLLVRPAALGLALLRSDLGRMERATVAWFGPKGFASVLYGLLVLQSGIEGRDLLFHAVAAAIVVSILAHSSTDVAVARAFRRRRGDATDEHEQPAARRSDRRAP